MGYMCMLCRAHLKAGILFALEEQSNVNIVVNFLSTFLPDMITGLFLYLLKYFYLTMLKTC